MKKKYFLNFIEDTSRLIIAIGLLILSIVAILLMLQINDVLIEDLTNYAYYFLILGLIIELLNLMFFSKKWKIEGTYNFNNNFIQKDIDIKKNITRKWKVILLYFPSILFIVIICFGINNNKKERLEDLDSLAKTRAISEDLSIIIKAKPLSPDLVGQITNRISQDGFLNISLLPNEDYYSFKKSYIFFPPTYKDEAGRIHEILRETAKNEFTMEEDERLENNIEIVIGDINQ